MRWPHAWVDKSKKERIHRERELIHQKIPTFSEVKRLRYNEVDKSLDRHFASLLTKE